MSIKLGTNELAGNAVSVVKNSRHLLEPFWSDHVLNDLDSLRADTFSWQDGNVYVDAYNHLVDDLVGATQKETYYKSNVLLNGTLHDTNGILTNFKRKKFIDHGFSSGVLLFTTENYAIIPQEFNPTTSGWEVVVKCKTPLSDTMYHSLVSGHLKNYNIPSFCVTYDNGLISLFLSSNGSTGDISDGAQSIATGMLNGSIYWIKLACAPSSGSYIYTLSFSEDGVSYEIVQTITSNLTIIGCEDIILGADQDSNIGGAGAVIYPWEGAIFLDGSYIKVGDTVTWVGTEKLSYYEAVDGHRICPATEHSKLFNMYGLTGQAWYYLLDTENTRFKLPRTKYGFTGLRNKVGESVTAGLPNIAGTISGNPNGDPNLEAFGETKKEVVDINGAFDGIYTNEHAVPDATDMGVMLCGFSIDANRSSSVYGGSDTVQPPAIQMYLYFYVGEFSKTSIEQVAGIKSEIFNNKLDTDAENVTEDGLFVMSGASFPATDTSKFINLTTNLNNGASYTAPSNGWFCVNYIISAGSWLAMISYPTDSSNNGRKVQTARYGSCSVGAVVDYNCVNTIAVTKGQVVNFLYDGNTDPTIVSITFIPAKGG